jgi:ribosomal protein S12 methylthiotransferase
VVGQDTTSYGSDTGEDDVAGLLSALARLEGLRWVRLLYGHPTGITDRLIEVMATEERICEYLDVPLQHAHADVLQRMGRPGDGDSYLRLIERLREAMPDIAIRSTFLLGFPGEREQEFETLLEFLRAAQLDRVGAFCYSPEAQTPAAAMPGRIAPAEAQQRYDELMVLQQQISLARNQRWIGRELDVLVESSGRHMGEWVGRSFRDAPEIDGAVTVRAPGGRGAAGEFIRARIVAAQPYDLVGETTAPGHAGARKAP